MKCEQDQYKNGVGFDCELVHDATQEHVKKAHWIPKRTPEFRNDCYESPEKRLPCRRVTLQKKVPFATEKKVNRVDDVLVGDCESHFTHRSHPSSLNTVGSWLDRLRHGKVNVRWFSSVTWSAQCERRFGMKTVDRSEDVHGMWAINICIIYTWVLISGHVCVR